MFHLVSFWSEGPLHYCHAIFSKWYHLHRCWNWVLLALGTGYLGIGLIEAWTMLHGLHVSFIQVAIVSTHWTIRVLGTIYYGILGCNFWESSLGFSSATSPSGVVKIYLSAMVLLLVSWSQTPFWHGNLIGSCGHKKANLYSFEIFLGPNFDVSQKRKQKSIC